MCQYIFEVVVGITDKGEAVFYDVVDMVPTNFDIKNAESPTTATTQNAIGDIHGNSAKNSLPQNSEKSSGNEQFSLSDSEVGLTTSCFDIVVSFVLSYDEEDCDGEGDKLGGADGKPNCFLTEQCG